MADVYPTYEDYQRRTDRQIPVSPARAGLKRYGAGAGADFAGGGGIAGAPTGPTCGIHSSQLRQVPVPVAEQLHRRGQQHARGRSWRRSAPPRPSPTPSSLTTTSDRVAKIANTPTITSGCARHHARGAS